MLGVIKLDRNHFKLVQSCIVLPKKKGSDRCVWGVKSPRKMRRDYNKDYNVLKDE